MLRNVVQIRDDVEQRVDRVVQRKYKVKFMERLGRLAFNWFAFEDIKQGRGITLDETAYLLKLGLVNADYSFGMSRYPYTFEEPDTFDAVSPAGKWQREETKEFWPVARACGILIDKPNGTGFIFTSLEEQTYLCGYAFGFNEDVVAEKVLDIIYPGIITSTEEKLIATLKLWTELNPSFEQQILKIALSNSAKYLNWRAFEALIDVGTEKIVSTLIQKGLYSSSKDKLQQTVTLLGELGAENALTVLIELLKDKDLETQFRVVCALTKIGSPKAIEPFTNFLKTQPATRVTPSVATGLEILNLSDSNVRKLAGKIAFGNRTKTVASALSNIAKVSSNNIQQCQEIKPLLQLLLKKNTHVCTEEELKDVINQLSVC